MKWGHKLLQSECGKHIMIIKMPGWLIIIRAISS